MRRLGLFLSPLSALLFAGCIDQISADLPAPPKKLVVNSIFTPDSIWLVQVGRVAAATDGSSRLLPAAQVSLRPAGGPTEALSSRGNGLYASANRPRRGAAYTLEVRADDYPTASATDTVPAGVPIREAWYAYPTSVDASNDLKGTVVVRFDDPAATADFYEIVCYQDGTQGITLDARGNAALVAEDDAGFIPTSLFFSDKLFNGQSFELRASFQPHSYGSGSNGPAISGNLYLALRSVSRAYYQSRKSWTRHRYNQGTKGENFYAEQLNQLLFLGDPSTLTSNVAGGYGVVAGYAQQINLLRRR